jgi:hypothetical protein
MNTATNRSQHLVGVSGGIEAVTGTLTVDTGLKDVQSIVATQLTDAAANEEGIVTVTLVEPSDGGNYKATLKVWKHGTASGDAGDSAVDVSWMAFGR